MQLEKNITVLGKKLKKDLAEQEKKQPELRQFLPQKRKNSRCRKIRRSS